MSLVHDDTVAPSPEEDPAADDPSGLLGCTLAGRYRIEGLLGEGGMGAVYRGFHLGLRRAIAIKVLRPEMTSHPQVSARFEREAQASSRLEHPNVVQIYDFGAETPKGRDQEIKFLVMQLLEGRELTELLGKPLAPERALELMSQIFAGLAHAHDRGIVHRDLKPDNVYVTTDHEGRELLKLVDFGIAKLVDGPDAPKLTQMGMVFGTPTYMSPEQATGGAVDARTDIYAAGVMLYEMLAGNPPFQADDFGTLLRQQVAKEPPPIEGLDPSVDELLQALLAKVVDERISSAEEALRRVQALRGEQRSEPAANTPHPAAPGSIARASVVQVQPASTGTLANLRVRGTQFWTEAGGEQLVQRLRGRDMRFWATAGGAGLAAVLAVFVLGSWLTGDDGAADASEPSASDALAVAADRVVDSLQGAVGMRAGDPELKHVDRLRTKGDRKGALKAARALLTSYPRDGRVHWRLALLQEDEAAMVESYRQALSHDPALIEDKEVYTDLAARLRDPQVPAGLVDVAADHAGGHMRDVLVERVNRDEKALPYQARHRLLSVLRSDTAAADLINEPLQDVLDLWQAHQAGTPCAAFSDALDAIEQEPDPYHLSSLAKAPVPKPGPAEDPGACEGLEERRRALLTEVAERYPDAQFAAPADYEKAAKKGRRRRRGIRRILPW